jgi:hypothetical protein
MWHSRTCNEKYKQEKQSEGEHTANQSSVQNGTGPNKNGNETQTSHAEKMKKQQKTSTKDDMDKANIKRKNIRSWDEMTSGDHEAGVNTNNYEEAIKRILRRSDTDAPRGAN